MTDFTFRIRCRIPVKKRLLLIEKPRFTIQTEFGYDVNLSSGSQNKNIKDSEKLILWSSGYSSEEEAIKVGTLVKDSLTVTFSKFKTGVIFGERSRTGELKEDELKVPGELFDYPQFVNDRLGLMVYPTDSPPLMVSSNRAEINIGTHQEDFFEVLNITLRNQTPLSDIEKGAYEIFSFSYFLSSSDARLFTLSMAFEMLLPQKPRPEIVRNRIREFINLVRKDEHIEESEKESLVGSLKYLENESIRQSGRRFVRERLPGREYMELPATKFFDHFYQLRSDLIHGNYPLPEENDIGKAAGNLETMLSDIFSGDLVDVQIR